MKLSEIRTSPWWVRFCVGWTVASIIIGAGCLVSKAAADPDPKRVGHDNICRLPDPDRPCWATPQNMSHWFYHGHTHGFDQLSPKFKFPPGYIHLWQAAFADWCSAHPAECKVRRAEETKVCWAWCTYRQHLKTWGCANVGKAVAWNCMDGMGGKSGMLYRWLNSENSLIIEECGGLAVAGFILGKVIGAVGGGGYCMWKRLIKAYGDDDYRMGVPHQWPA